MSNEDKIKNPRIEESLRSMFFSDREIKILMQLFEKNELLSENILFSDSQGKKAVKDLVNRGLISEKKIQDGKIYYLESSESVFSWFRNFTTNRVYDIEMKNNMFLNALRPMLGSSIKTKMRFYEGIEGIKESYYHILDHANKEIMSYYSVVETVQPDLQSFLENEYVSERLKRKIFSRNIAPKTPKTTYFKMKSEESLMDIRFVPTEYFPLLNAEINLYEDYMHCMVFNENGGYAFILKEEDIVKIQKSIFQIAWVGANSALYRLPIAGTRKDRVDSGEDLNTVDNVYLTDNIDSIIHHIQKRRAKFPPNLKNDFPRAKATTEQTSGGDTILRVCDLEVMSDFEKPYMRKLAQIATIHGGDILNIGFGMGIADDYIEQFRKTRKIGEHHIIEINESICKRAHEWRNKQEDKDRIFIHQGDWEDILPTLQKNKLVFDGVLYDGFPLDISEVCRDSVRFLYSLIHLRLVREKTGIITFYVDSEDGFGESFQKYLYTLGVNDIQLNRVNVELPNRNLEYWDRPYFLAPLLTDIAYK